MPDLDTLKSLLVRVREAAGSDNRLGNDLKELARGPVIEGAQFSGVLFWSHGCPTSSIDAALELVERTLPGWTYTLTRYAGMNGSRSECSICGPIPPGTEYVMGQEAATLPLAALQAMLTALIAQAERTDKAMSDLAASDADLI